MKKLSKHGMDQLLSEYVDGTLPDGAAREVESLLQADTSARRQVEELRRLKGLLASRQTLPHNIGFWTRLSAGLEDARNEEHNLLPFPRRYVPAASGIAVLAMITAGVFIAQNRGRFAQFFSEKSQAAREVYEKEIVHGSVLPLFSNVNKDQAMQFSLFGTLPLDTQSETALRIDEQSAKGYRIEVGKDSQRKTKQGTFDHFIAQVRPTQEQRIVIDSLLELTGKRIESSVLIGENNTMAIAPDLPRFNRVMVTSIASCLEPAQRVRMEKFLEANDAPYSVQAQGAPVENAERIFRSVARTRHSNRYVIITPDTMLCSQMSVDFDSLRRDMEDNLRVMESRREAILRRIMARDFPHVPRGVLPPPQIFNVEINGSNEEIDPQRMHVVILPRVRRQMVPPNTPPPPIQVRVWEDSVSVSAP